MQLLIEQKLQVATIALQNILNRRNVNKVNKEVFIGTSCDTEEEDCLYFFLLKEMREFYNVDNNYLEKIFNHLYTYNSFVLEYESVLETEKNNFNIEICEDCCKGIGEAIIGTEEDCNSFTIGPCDNMEECVLVEFLEEEFECIEFN